MLTQERLKEAIHYDPESGVFTRLISAGGQAAGSIAGSISIDGYRQIRIDGKHYRGARLAFLYMTGVAPLIVDHINRKRHDDRWENIREADFSQNAANNKLSIRNKSGFKGVSWDKRLKRWRVRVNIDGRQRLIGYFDNLELAGLAAAEARRESYGEFAL
ncbi:hypothetical protein QE443_002663 [Pantoea ananatis]|uniref:HNH endonuclease n=1 Tax=Pantoea ananas TaxID=553 RepID=UPI00278B3FF9|nr:AP2 domain-containing protein [Pantoea ananatis]MDQ1226502.1 hypothetical protein [Pantoea ananatis]MDR6088380.1 hypothetical protein [Pantoea ananatis]